MFHCTKEVLLRDRYIFPFLHLNFNFWNLHLIFHPFTFLLYWTWPWRHCCFFSPFSWRLSSVSTQPSSGTEAHLVSPSSLGNPKPCLLWPWVITSAPLRFIPYLIAQSSLFTIAVIRWHLNQIYLVGREAFTFQFFSYKITILLSFPTPIDIICVLKIHLSETSNMANCNPFISSLPNSFPYWNLASASHDLNGALHLSENDVPLY